MADIIVDGKILVYWLPAVANLAAPTVAELNAGIKLSRILTKDGLPGWEPDTARVETTPLDGKFNTNKVGRSSFGDPMFRFKKQTGVDTIYNTLVKEAEGIVAIRRDIDRDVAWAAGQPVEMYPAQCGETKRLAIEENTVSRYEVPITITDEPELRATVAA
ncbi:hypothetical protein GCM10027280_45330 [Micromonospora polyrhachis]|uniref:Uncharacterized protein n=1 Tax=Micromonospora polyrhachis TaxID=1282883 RepID=A0A7W7WQ69_9ACTN|nr:hypothetical protein [Micromonospora polyrhachis]MBB4958953.1 hypothetical protein [Micromonospora polyrhachis]